MRPTREHATNNGQTYMITSSTWGRRALFSQEVWAKLLIDTLYHYRGAAYLLHEFARLKGVPFQSKASDYTINSGLRGPEPATKTPQPVPNKISSERFAFAKATRPKTA